MDISKITNGINTTANTYVTKEINKDNEVKKYSISGKTIGQPKLTKEAKSYYEELQAKYKNMDFLYRTPLIYIYPILRTFLHSSYYAHR